MTKECFEMVEFCEIHHVKNLDLRENRRLISNRPIIKFNEREYFK